MDANQGAQGVIKLEGSKNWNVWKFQTTVILRGKGLLDIVEGKIEKPKKDEKEFQAWLNNDASQGANSVGN